MSLYHKIRFLLGTRTDAFRSGLSCTPRRVLRCEYVQSSMYLGFGMREKRIMDARCSGVWYIEIVRSSSVSAKRLFAALIHLRPCRLLRQSTKHDMDDHDAVIINNHETVHKCRVCSKRNSAPPIGHLLHTHDQRRRYLQYTRKKLYEKTQRIIVIIKVERSIIVW